MGVSITNQVYVFFCCIFGGLAIGLLFDFFKITKQYIPTNGIMTYFEDILFWLLVGAISLATIYYSNNGELRGFVFLGLILGTIIYFLIFSNVVSKTLSLIISIIAKFIEATFKTVWIPISMVAKTVIKIIKLLDNTSSQTLKYFKRKNLKLSRILKG